jgi:5'/3'-nucleotidase SurE/tRNA pseudouridine(38-40) synthase
LRARLVLEYDGTEFAGWARQPGSRTVQGEVERALGVLLRRDDVALTVAGRTDAGVHAWGQVASYEGEPAPNDGLNALLPADVAALACTPASADFDARRDATSRAYCYRVLARRVRSAHERGRALHWPHKLDQAALEACAAATVGTHDFTAFTPTETEHVRFHRDVLAASWRRALDASSDVFEFWIEADSFMRHMNRVLVGTMLEVAGGRRSLADFVALLDGRPRSEAGPTAPPSGLYLELPGVELAVIAPDGNRSAMARSITTRRPLWVQEVDFDDGTVGYATDGTPVDCVRLARLGLIEGFEAELVVSGINHGSNLGDDITYSGTVAAALEAIVLGLPGIAVSQQSRALELDFRAGMQFEFDLAAGFTARLVAELETVPLPEGTLLNINVPGGEPGGVEVARLGKRIYRDELALVDEASGGRRLYRIYGDASYERDETGTDLAAVAQGKIAVTPIHFDLTDRDGLDALQRYDLARLIAPAAEELGT